MNSIEHQQLRKSLALLALDKLEDGERSALRLHLLACPECRAELDDFRAVAALLREHMAGNASSNNEATSGATGNSGDSGATGSTGDSGDAWNTSKTAGGNSGDAGNGGDALAAAHGHNGAWSGMVIQH